MCAALATPMVASAGDQTIPPEAQWTPTPPARAMVDANRLAGMLVSKGVITPHEYTHLTQSQASSRAAPPCQSVDLGGDRSQPRPEFEG
jgi:hypothetical protein